MDNLQAIKALDRIYSNGNINFKNNKSCVFIDGEWGIGKTEFIKGYFAENQDEYELIYTSVFGKNSIKDIEKAILIHSLPGFKNFNEDNGVAKAAKSIFSDITNKFLGVSIDNYINSFSIEDVKWNALSNKRRFICFDDIERKSDTIEMKSLLGLIERAKKNFDVIIISNGEELSEKDRYTFNTYNEKVIDHVIKINSISEIIFTRILHSMDINNRNEIIDVYLADNVAFGKAPDLEKTFLKSKIYNLRVFIKYVELIKKLEKYLEQYKVDENILKMCKTVIYDHYYSDKEEKNKAMNFDKYNIYKTVYKILLNEDVEKDDFKEYFIANSEVREDINSIYNVYKLREIECENLVSKIKAKIKNMDLKYFIKQSNVISLVSALYDIKKIDKDIAQKLLKIAIELYSPENLIPHEKIEYSRWNDFDMNGNEIECANFIQVFIEKINEKCEEKYQNFINQKKQLAWNTKNYEKLLALYNYNEINKTEEFAEIFDYYFDQLVESYSNEISQQIITLINKTDSASIFDFFSNRIKNETQITKIKKYEQFDMQLEMKIEHEQQVEYWENNPPEECE